MVSLHNKFGSKGLKILAFPCNQFGGQEPGSLQEIKEFVKERNVQFELTEKVDVNGPNTCDTYRFLKVLARCTIYAQHFEKHIYYFISSPFYNIIYLNISLLLL